MGPRQKNFSGRCWAKPPEMNALATPAVTSGRSVIRSPDLSSKVYISLVTMSEVSPRVRWKTSVNSIMGVDISSYP